MSEYKAEYCEQLINHMSKGLSFESFVGVLGITKGTLKGWIDQYPDFYTAREKGHVSYQLFWEKLGIQGIAGRIPGFNSSLWAFNMKNRFGWEDNTKTIPNKTKQKYLKAMSNFSG